MAKARSSSNAGRRRDAVQSFKTAADCIGPITPGMSLFAITRGQFSMIDAVMHVLDCAGPANVSLWTWSSTIVCRSSSDASVAAAGSPRRNTEPPPYCLPLLPRGESRGEGQP